MTTKLVNNKRRSHAEKVLQGASKKATTVTGPINDNYIARPVENDVDNLKNQYEVIKEDLAKLRTDIAKGYDLARIWMEKKGAVKDFLRAR